MSQTEAQWQANNRRWWRDCQAEDRRRFVPEQVWRSPNDRSDYPMEYTEYSQPSWLWWYHSEWDYELSYANHYPEEKKECCVQ